jgi:hypothetical protein
VIKQKQLEQMPKQAADAQQVAGAAQPFAGKQAIFDERYMPGAPPVAPTTQPTSVTPPPAAAPNRLGK